MPSRSLLTSTSLADAALLTHTEGGRDWPLLVWVPGPGVRMVSSAVLGGGIGTRAWVLNAQVPPGYDRLDPVAHLRELAAGAGLEGAGVGLMTAASVADHRHAADGGVRAVVTAGIGVRGWAAAPGTGGVAVPRPGTINIIVSLPVPLTDAALVNAVATATEAKVQALVELGADASGTPTDAVCVAAPTAAPGSAAEPFAGPRSLWGARLARAVHAATREACAGLLAA
ncbi:MULTISPECIES: adenosylcobinamide amidohydrolase [unclassified Streptomyces]|uniref:adenosylcobinamide amidohydrolase n=1 Tax=unclassified Streptomyces TaxID=2593676 RepID=UPI0006F461D9|nr:MULTISPECIES: adenosylcobinamide amidohydrolase [unclassified Streptomyces]KQX57481.1 adenosylcobinamide amidohydrolase [Streptomyces sp. Root1304]KRA98853.1 adenosylcobinamide amidohydrolase [Streptomyces sp. Root66D1]